MKILFIAPNFPPDIGGMERYAYEVVSRASFEYDTVVICLKVSKNIKAGKAKILPLLNRCFISREFIALFIQILKKEKPDVIHILGASCSFLSLIAKYISKKPVIITCHGRDFISPWGKYFFLRNLREAMKAGLSFCDRIITVSHYNKEQLVNLGAARRKIKIIFNGVDTKIFRPKKPTIKIRGINKNSKVLFTASRIDPRKGFGTVIKALPLVLKTEPNLKYIIAGNMLGVPDVFIRQNIFQPTLKALGLEKNVIYVGGITNQKVLAEYYNLCDIFIMVPKEIKKSSIGKSVESFGIVFLEANACGKPVIASKTGGIPDAVIHGKTGILVEQENVKETARAIITLLKNTVLRKRMGLWGRNRAKEYFSWDKNIEQLSLIYKKCPSQYSKMRLSAYLRKFGISAIPRER